MDEKEIKRLFIAYNKVKKDKIEMIEIAVHNGIVSAFSKKK